MPIFVDDDLVQDAHRLRDQPARKPGGSTSRLERGGGWEWWDSGWMAMASDRTGGRTSSLRLRCGRGAVVVAVSRTQSSAVTVDWEERENPTEWDKLPARKKRRRRRLAIEYYAACLAFERSDATPETPLSLANCEKVSRSAETAEPSSDSSGELELPETMEDLEYVPDSVEAIREARFQEDDERFRRVVELVKRGEVSHAKNVATCRKKSVELECGHCGSRDNYAPVSCDSRLCEDCMNRKMGKVVNQYLPRVKRWDWPTTIRLSLPERVEPTEEAIDNGVSELRQYYSRLLDRVMPVEGEHQNRRWVWWHDGGEPATCRLKPRLRSAGAHELARQWQKQYVSQGNGIPMREVLQGGFYGIDLKQDPETGTVNIHMHVLCDCPWLPQGALSQMWDEIAGAPVVDIRRVQDRDEGDREDALMEVIGYAAKSPDWRNAEEAVSYQLALKGSKLVQPFGSLHGNTPPTSGELFCTDCETAPRQWHYNGTVDGCFDTTSYGTDSRGKDPPE